MPPSRACAPAHILRKSKGPIGRWVAACAVPGIVAARPETEDLDTQFAAIAAVKHIDVVTIQLKTSLDDVAAASIDEHIVKSGHRGGEFFRDAGGTEIRERSGVDVCNRPTTERKF